MNLFVTIYSEARLLGHFLRHYDREKSAEDFLLGPPVPCGDCGGAISEAKTAYSMTPVAKTLCRTDQHRVAGVDLGCGPRRAGAQ